MEQILAKFLWEPRSSSIAIVYVSVSPQSTPHPSHQLHSPQGERRPAHIETMALESLYKTLMRRNSVYIGFIIAGAFVGEKALNGAIDMMWESSNKGKLYKHLEASLNEDN